MKYSNAQFRCRLSKRLFLFPCHTGCVSSVPPGFRLCTCCCCYFIVLLLFLLYISSFRISQIYFVYIHCPLPVPRPRSSPITTHLCVFSLKTSSLNFATPVLSDLFVALQWNLVNPPEAIPWTACPLLNGDEEVDGKGLDGRLEGRAGGEEGGGKCGQFVK